MEKRGKGRPEGTTKGQMPAMGLRLPEDLMEKLKQEAQEKKTTPSKLVRALLEQRYAGV